MKKINHKNIILLTLSLFLLVSFGPKNARAQVDSSVPQESETQENEGFTREQQEQLEINEDAVMNPFPG